MPPTTLSPTWSLLCWNLTMVGQHQHSAVLRATNSSAPVAQWPPMAVPAPLNGTTQDADGMDDKDRHALLYIVVVLLFYSTGIVVAIVMYLKREKAEIEEEKAYEDYAKFRSDPDHWARYFRVQRMIAQLDRVERQAAEKRLQQTEIAEEPRSLKKSPWRPNRRTSASSALKIFVFGSGSQRGDSETDPSPLLAAHRGNESSLKPCRSAGGRLDACYNTLPADSLPFLTIGLSEGLSRTRSCDESAGIGRPAADKIELKRCPESTSTTQVSHV